MTPENPQPAKSTGEPVNEEHSCLVVRSDEAGVSQFLRFVEFLGKRWNIPDDVFAGIHVSLSEAIENSVRHGNRFSGTKTITIHATCEQHHYVFTLKDEGDGFDYRRVQPPTDDENLMKTSGRGIYIMRHLADFVSYSSEGKSVKLVFNKVLPDMVRFQ